MCAVYTRVSRADKCRVSGPNCSDEPRSALARRPRRSTRSSVRPLASTMRRGCCGEKEATPSSSMAIRSCTDIIESSRAVNCAGGRSKDATSAIVWFSSRRAGCGCQTGGKGMEVGFIDSRYMSVKETGGDDAKSGEGRVVRIGGAQSRGVEAVSRRRLRADGRATKANWDGENANQPRGGHRHWEGMLNGQLVRGAKARRGLRLAALGSPLALSQTRLYEIGRAHV